jgi:hypothetical protein
VILPGRPGRALPAEWQSIRSAFGAEHADYRHYAAILYW